MSTPSEPQTSSLVTTGASNLSSTSITSQTWLQKHTVLIIAILSITLGYFLTDKAIAIVASYESHKAQQAQTVLATQAKTSDEDLTEAKAQLVVYENALAASTKENATLTAAITSRNQAESTQQKTDATLPPSQLATRWEALVNNTGVATAAKGYTVTDDAAVNTVQQLEQIPVLTQNLADMTTEEAGLQKTVSTVNQLVLDGKSTIGSLQSQLTDQTKQCSTDEAALKSQIVKSKVASVWEKAKWFGYGFVSGFITGVFK